MNAPKPVVNTGIKLPDLSAEQITEIDMIGKLDVEMPVPIKMFGMPSREDLKVIRKAHEECRMVLLFVSSPVLKTKSPEVTIHNSKGKIIKTSPLVKTTARISEFLKANLTVSEQNHVAVYFLGYVNEESKQDLAESILKTVNNPQHTSWIPPTANKSELPRTVNNVSGVLIQESYGSAGGKGDLGGQDGGENQGRVGCKGDCGGCCSDKKCVAASDDSYSLKA